jgi:hypothetical protein
MDVISISPFRAGSVLWRPRPDRWTLTVVSKATYTLAQGESALAAEQEGVNERDAFWDDDPRRSLFAPSDLAPFKPRADVILVGHAYAPRSELVRSLVTRLMVGEMEKAVEVFCPRVLGREGDLREGQRWSKMPLRYEYAAGGLDTWNPVGVGPSAPTDPYGQRPLPHLQPPGLRVSQWRDIFVPTGFGPISPSWRLRREKLGRRAEGWSEEGWTRIALDDDFDGEFFQTAPPDQQIETLHDDERLVLEYLHPDHPSLTTKLPGVHPRAFVEIPGTQPRDLLMTPDTLWIHTDRAICTLTWRGQVAVDGPDQQGRVLIALEQAGQHLTWTAVSGQRSPTTISPASDEPLRGTHALPFIPPELAGAPPESKDEPAEPVPTPRTLGRRRTLQMGAEVPPPRAPEEASTLIPRQTLQMVTDVPPPAAPTWLTPVASPAAVSASSVTLAAVVEPPVESVEASQPAGGRRATAPARDPAFELTWFTPSLGPRLRRLAAFAPLLPAEGSAALDVAAVLSRGAPSSANLEQVLFENVAEGGTLSPALLLVAGELSFSFDEVDELRTLIASASPTSRGDVGLAGLLEFAQEMAKTELQASPEVAEGLCSSVRDAWAQANQVLPATHLGQQVERALLFRRAYQRRELLGKKWIRALFLLASATGATPVPAYLPAVAAARLPLFRRFPARLLAEILPPQDQSEASPVALRIAALAREIHPRPAAAG